jgi:hypothetical protein
MENHSFSWGEREPRGGNRKPLFTLSLILPHQGGGNAYASSIVIDKNPSITYIKPSNTNTQNSLLYLISLIRLRRDFQLAINSNEHKVVDIAYR